MSREPLRFFQPPAIEAAGGLCAPVADAYALSNMGRPIRDAFVRQMDLALIRQKLRPEERIAFDIIHRGYAEFGHPDVAAKVCEDRTWDDEDYDWDYDSSDHVWDRPARPVGLRYVR